MNYTPKPVPNFYGRLREIMGEKGVSRYKLVKDNKIYDSYFSNWKNGANPHILTLIMLADYLDCTIDYLVGRDRD